MKVGICVGHSRRGDRGAWSVGNVPEWEWNNILAAMIVDRLPAHGIEPVLANDYHYSSYSAAMGWLAGYLKHEDVDFAIELHFNSAGPSARGNEWLHWHSSGDGRALAASLDLAFNDAFPDSKPRGLKPKRAGDRGSTFLRKTHCPAVITEPFFGSNADEWDQFSMAQDLVADAMVEGIARL